MKNLLAKNREQKRTLILYQFLWKMKMRYYKKISQENHFGMVFVLGFFIFMDNLLFLFGKKKRNFIHIRIKLWYNNKRKLSRKYESEKRIK